MEPSQSKFFWEGSHDIPVGMVRAGRDPQLDAFRGFLLILMTLDHLPGVLRDYSLEFGGYVSAAEGFVFLSGFVAGLLYTRMSFEEGSSSVWRRALRRARTIYLYHVFTFVLVLVFMYNFGSEVEYRWSWEPILHIHFLTAVALGSTLVFQPLFLDILPMYCLFILLVPLVIEQLRAGKKHLVFGISFLLWLLAQFHLQNQITSLLSPKIPIALGGFDVFAWQFLFVSGVGFGFASCFPEQNVRPRRSLLYGSLFIAVLFFCLRHEILVDTNSFPLIAWLTDKTYLGVVRLFNVAVVFYLVARLHDVWKRGCFLKGLGFLGRYSLQVFTFHVLLVCFLYSILSHVAVKSTSVSLLLSALCIGSLFLPAWIFDTTKRYH
jgi:hypothetical protein